jgi:hypothetical protein
MKQRLLIIGVALALLLPAICGLAAQGNSAATQIMATPGDGMIVLGDVTFTIAPDARFFAKDERTPIPLANFKEGDWVEFSVNSNGEIDEMWLSSERK